MWTDIKSTYAMGLHPTTSKRKHEIEFDNKKEKDQYLNGSPIKTIKWSTETSNITSNVTVSETIGTEDSIAKLEEVAAAPCEPSWNSEPVDCISKLQAVAVPTDAWGSISTKSTLATTLLSAEEMDDEEDDFEDDYEEEESIIPTYCPLRYPLPPPQRNYSSHGFTKPSFYSEPFPQQNCSRTGNQQQMIRSPQSGNFSWSNNNNQNGNYYVPGESTSSYTTPHPPPPPPHPPQQTIRCAENGKSYLELGSSTNFNTGLDAVHSKRCCDGRGTWCNTKNCYREIRLKIRNLSMFKLSRFRQVSEQSLYRSVLICNTLKKIDNEIECEGKDTSSNTGINLDYSTSLGCPRIPNSSALGMTNNNQGFQQQQQQQQQQQHHQHQQQHQQSHFSNSTTNTDNRDCSSVYNHSMSGIKSSTTTTPILTFNTTQCPSETLHPYDHYPFRDNQSGRATPFPTSTTLADSDSGFGDEDANRSINWSSVLSLSSQSALDPLNNNDLFSTITPAHSTLPSPPPPSPPLPPQPPATSSSAATTAISGTFTASSVNNNSNNSAIIQNSSTGILQTSITSSSSWEYGFLDMDLGLGPEFTELVPSCKLSSEDLFKSVTPSMNSSRYIHDNELVETPAHIMVGS